MIEELIDLAKEVRAARGRGQELNLTEDELASYAAREQRQCGRGARRRNATRDRPEPGRDRAPEHGDRPALKEVRLRAPWRAALAEEASGA